MLSEQAKDLMRRMQNEQIRELADKDGIEKVLIDSSWNVTDLDNSISTYLADFVSDNEDISTDKLAEQIAKTKIMLKQITYLLECQEKVNECYDAELNRQLAEIRKK